jgi:hypothetical protein
LLESFVFLSVRFTRSLLLLTATACLLLAGCSESSSPNATLLAAPNNTSATTASGSCSVVRYGQPRALANFDDKRISESSGIARSIVYDSCFWTHNDGKTPRLYLINKEGATVAVVKLELAAGADEFLDCEDIGSFLLDGKPYLLYADTGDNERNRREYALHLIEEPQELKERGTKKPQNVAVAMTIPFRFPDGSNDCEAMAVDPTTCKVYLMTKERNASTIYELDLPASAPKQPLVARRIARIDTPMVAAMDMSPDGRRAIVLTDRAAYEFARGADEGWDKAFRRQLCRLQMPARGNGEAICYGADGKTLYLTSEGSGEPLWEIPVH